MRSKNRHYFDRNVGKHIICTTKMAENVRHFCIGSMGSPANTSCHFMLSFVDLVVAVLRHSSLLG